MNINVRKYIGKTLDLPAVGPVKVMGVQLREDSWATIRYNTPLSSDLMDISLSELEQAWRHRNVNKK